jgi:hypothetical protein
VARWVFCRACGGAFLIMIHEFALDPEVLNSWQSIRFFISQFGIHTGRMISKYPKKWKNRVYETCSECGEIEKKRIEVALQNIDSKLIKRMRKDDKSRAYDNELDWLTNAYEEYKITPFHAIISKKNPYNVPFILISDVIDENTPHWSVNTGYKVLRNANDLADKISSLLLCSKEILFVDPYFNPEKARYSKCLKKFLAILKDNGHYPDTVEYHTSTKTGISESYFIDTCLPKVQQLMPSGITLLIKRWEETDTGDVLHPRYILTDRGGLCIEHGLDEGDSPGETTDVSFLDECLYKERWKDYHEETSSFGYLEGYSVSQDSIEKL